MTGFDLYQRVAINKDVPSENLKKGDLGWLIDYVEHPQGGETGAILEIYNILGEHVRVVTVPVSAIEPLRADWIPSVRVFDQAS